MTEFYYSIAGFGFTLEAPVGCNIQQWLPSFQSFQVLRAPEHDLFRMTVSLSIPILGNDLGGLLEEASMDAGVMRLYQMKDGYWIDMCYEQYGLYYSLKMNASYTLATVYLPTGIPYASKTLAAMIRIVFAQAIIPRGGFTLHASAVSLHGHCVMFLGKSGTGKSTHAQLWMQAFQHCELLNDDNPVVRLEGDKVIAYGTPWSGKTPCYKNQCIPVKGFVRLVQADSNVYTPMIDEQAFITLLPSCSVMSCNASLRDRLYDLLVTVCNQIRIGRLECRVDVEAALVCYKNIFNNNHFIDQSI